MLPWFASPPDEAHITASELITIIWMRDSYTGETVAQMPWIVDGISGGEIAALRALAEPSYFGIELGRGVAESQWVTDGLSEGEIDLLSWALPNVASRDPDLAVLLFTPPWAMDGLDDAEWLAFDILVRSGTERPELVRLLASSPWVADGAGRTEPLMGNIISYFNEIEVRDPETAMLVATAPWVVDGVGIGEARVIQYVSNYLESFPENARLLLDLPQALEGLAAYDRLLYDLAPIAFWDRPTALTVSRYADVATEDMGSYLIRSLTQFAEGDLNRFDELIEQPWFADGLDGGEAALVSTLHNIFRTSPTLYYELLETHYVQSKTVSLPLAGDVNIWVVHNAPPPPGEDLLKEIADTARISEEYLGTEFPTTDIILLVITPGNSEYGIGGHHAGSHMVLNRSKSKGEVNGVPHETAHYYFYFNVGQVWFREGAAQFIEAYVNHRTGEQPLADRRAQMSAETGANCVGIGTENIRHFTYELEHIYEGRFWPGGCGYIMGENFLLHAYYALGAESMSAALRELLSRNQDYLLGEELVRPPTEEDIYDTFLEHTPADRKETFRDLYRRLHGGAFAFPTTDFSDEHGDEPSAASAIAVGQAIVGDLDYMFDFDYFRFQAVEGQKYRMNVNHNSLRISNITLLGLDGVTQEIWNWKSRRLTPSGPQILWVAPGSGDYYFAVQNFGGKTGQYTLTIAPVADVEDDHGDSLATATYASLGEVVQGAVEDEFDLDYFRFRVEAGRRYQLSVSRETLEYFRMKLYASDGAPPRDWYGNQFADNSASGDTVEWVAPSSGEFYASVEGHREHLGAYTFTITSA